MRLNNWIGLSAFLLAIGAAGFHVTNMFLCVRNRRPDAKATFFTFWDPLIDWDLLTPKGRVYAKRCLWLPAVLFALILVGLVVKILPWFPVLGVSRIT